MRCPLNFLLTLGALSLYGSALAAPASNVTLSADGSPPLDATLPPEGHPDTGVQINYFKRTTFEAGKVVHNCLHVMSAGWVTTPVRTIDTTTEIMDTHRAWSQAVRVKPAPTSHLVFTSRLLAYAAGDILDDIWSRYAEEATIFRVCPYRILEKAGQRRAIADWDFLHLPPPGDGSSTNNSHGLPIQYLSSSSSSSSDIDNNPTVAVSKRQDTAGGSSSSSTNTTDTTDDDDDDLLLPLTLPVPKPSPLTESRIHVNFVFSNHQRLTPKSLLVLPAQFLRSVIFRYRPPFTVGGSGFIAGNVFSVSRLSYQRRHWIRLTVLDPRAEWMDLASAVLALLPPPTDQQRWDAYVALFTLRVGKVRFAKVEMWEGSSEGGGGVGLGVGVEGGEGGGNGTDSVQVTR